MKHTLNKLYFEYLTGDLLRGDFEGLVYTHLFNNQEKTCLSHWKSDEYEDFISWFYPRLRKSIDLYQETGNSFEAFLAKYILISSKEYQARTVSNAITEYSTWNARIPEMYVHEEPPAYTHRHAEHIISQLITSRKGRKNSKRVLALVIKCYYFVSEDFAEKIAKAIEINPKELIDMLDRIREIRRKKDDEIYFLKERIYRQFYRCAIYDKKLSLARYNTAAHEKTKLRLEKAKERLEKMRKRMINKRMEATNKQVAEVIGIKKGTVDSSLHQLKSRWDEMAKKTDLN